MSCQTVLLMAPPNKECAGSKPAFAQVRLKNATLLPPAGCSEKFYLNLGFIDLSTLRNMAHFAQILASGPDFAIFALFPETLKSLIPRVQLTMNIARTSVRRRAAAAQKIGGYLCWGRITVLADDARKPSALWSL